MQKKKTEKSFASYLLCSLYLLPAILYPYNSSQGLLSIYYELRPLLSRFNSVRPHRQQPTRLRRPWDSPGKNTEVGCHFLLQCMKVKSESEFAQSCLTPSTEELMLLNCGIGEDS